MPSRSAVSTGAVGAVRIGTVGGVAVAVSGSSVLLVALLAIGFAPRAAAVEPGLGYWAYGIGAVVGTLIYVAAFVHEVAHALLARRYGHRVHSITLSMLGGRTAVDGEAATPGEELITAFVGPLASIGLGGVAFGLYALSGDGVVAAALEVLVLANLVLGFLDLVPAPPLDGGRVVRAIGWAVLGSRQRGGIAAGWSGRVVAAAVVVTALVVRPHIVYLVTAGAVAVLLWLAATAELSATRLRGRWDTVVLADLVQPLLSVSKDLPLAEALRRADAAGAAGIVTLDARDDVVGLVGSSAVTRTPEERRPWVPVSSVARPADAATRLGDDLRGAALLRALSAAPATEYLVVGVDGELRGVVRLDDLDRELRRS